ncbi:proteasome assembly chaperone family protein [Natronorarus salvus]|uniref:proteasome assembly chaperone family protein n=1 Tax=Natronorarus salvus TaxID=3117733 RepID=UPI002F26A068
MVDSRDPQFSITHDYEPAETLVVGLSGVGLAGLTAVDYLVDHLGMSETGSLSAEGLPAITPFTAGTPRHHTRIYSHDDVPVDVLVGELFVPVWAANAFARSILEWTEAHGTEEVVLLMGIPLAHGPDDHKTFYVATEDYQEHRLFGTEVPAMGTGFLDGVNASLVGQGMDSDLGVCVLVTPVHARTPDADAALRLVSTLESIYGIDVDVAPLEEFAGEIQQHYAQLSERLQQAAVSDVPEDRMYM